MNPEERMTAPSIQIAEGWRGRTMIGAGGGDVGTISDIYLDDSGRPEWALVDSGRPGTRSVFVPLTGCWARDGRVHVPYTETQVADAPGVEPGGALSEAEEDELYHHYGMFSGDSSDPDFSDPGAVRAGLRRHTVIDLTTPVPTVIPMRRERTRPERVELGEGQERR
jgi:hypothetical protein